MTARRKTRWSEDEIDRFTRWWDQGLTRKVIANKMATYGRPISTSTIGDKAKSLGLKKRDGGRKDDWSPDAKRTIEELWGQGYSARQVAIKISHMRKGGVTRNMVISIVHRMGLSKRQAPRALPHTKAKSKVEVGHEMRSNHAKSTVITKKTTKPLPKSMKADKDRIGPTIEQLGPTSCRWPVGTKTGAEQMFCGKETDHKAGRDGQQAYCCEHLARSKTNMSDEQREQISERMKAHHRAKKTQNASSRKKAA